MAYLPSMFIYVNINPLFFHSNTALIFPVTVSSVSFCENNNPVKRKQKKCYSENNFHLSIEHLNQFDASPGVKSEISFRDIWQSTSNAAGSTRSHMTNLHNRLWKRANTCLNQGNHSPWPQRRRAAPETQQPLQISSALRGKPGPVRETSMGSRDNFSLKSKQVQCEKSSPICMAQGAQGGQAHAKSVVFAWPAGNPFFLVDNPIYPAILSTFSNERPPPYFLHSHHAPFLI